MSLGSISCLDHFEVITTAIVGEKMYINGLIFKPSMMKKLPLKSNQTNIKLNWLH